MDAFHRAYAHTAWTPADPLTGLEPHERRAILLMPSTFHERLRMAPWRNQDQRRAAMFDIIAERRLAYDLYVKQYQDQHPAPQANSLPLAPVVHPTAPPSPYYQYRLGMHADAIHLMANRRLAEDLHERRTNPAAQAEYEIRLERRRALLDLEMDRVELDIREQAILSGAHARRTGRAPTRSKTRKLNHEPSP